MIQIGKLLRASSSGCVLGCKTSQDYVPEFGSLVRIPLEDKRGYQLFALVYDIHVDDDELVRQLVTSQEAPPEVIMDNRLNRNVPLELSALFVGYRLADQIYHLLPPRPPLALDAIYACTPEELHHFCASGRFGYFRHILRAGDLPVGELLAVHLKQVDEAARERNCPEWATRAAQELITLLRDDYSTLMSVLSALADAGIEFHENG